MSNLQRGVAATELVFALPIFIVIFITVLYYGYAFLVYRVAIEAANAGARAAVAESPLNDNYSDSVGRAAQNTARRIVAEFLNVDVDSIDADSCIAPPFIPLGAEVTQYQYRVSLNFSSCNVLKLLRIKFPGLGSLPPALGEVKPVLATVQL